MLGRATWVVVDRADPWIVTPDSPILTRHPEVVRAFVARLDRDPALAKVFERDGVLVFRRYPAELGRGRATTRHLVVAVDHPRARLCEEVRRCATCVVSSTMTIR